MEILERLAYDLQFFEFSCAQIANERRRLIRTGVDCILDDVINHIEMPETGEMLKRKKDDVVKRMLEGFNDKLNDLDKLDKKYFTIPGHVLLENDLDNTCNYNESVEKLLDEEIVKLKQRLVQNSVMLTALKSENSQYETVSALLDQEISMHKQMSDGTLALDLHKLHDLAKKNSLCGSWHKNIYFWTYNNALKISFCLSTV